MPALLATTVPPRPSTVLWITATPMPRPLFLNAIACEPSANGSKTWATVSGARPMPLSGGQEIHLPAPGVVGQALQVPPRQRRQRMLVRYGRVGESAHGL